MNINIFCACLFVVAGFSACSSKQPDQDPSIIPAGNTTSSQAAIVADTISPSTTTAPNTTTISGTPTQTAIPATVTTVPTSTVSKPVATAAGLNPAHGQPGHRCDISVGAPLNSPVQNTSPVVSTSVPATTTSATPAAVKQPTVNASGARLNPAHGQPGHDCKIAVGQPLP